MYLLRHGESEFNVHFSASKRDPGIEDPHLTPLGMTQARDAAAALAHAPITRILVSPYTRALQTAQVVAVALSVQPEIEPLVRERYAFTCDIGTSRAQLRTLWPTHDFAALEETWWPDQREPEATVIARAAQFRAAMRERADSASTLLVSHWGFLLALTGRSVDNGAVVRWEPADPAPETIIWRR